MPTAFPVSFKFRIEIRAMKSRATRAGGKGRGSRRVYHAEDVKFRIKMKSAKRRHRHPNFTQYVWYPVGGFQVRVPNY